MHDSDMHILLDNETEYASLIVDMAFEWITGKLQQYVK